MDQLRPVLNLNEPLSFYGVGVLRAIPHGELPREIDWNLQSRAFFQGALTGTTVVQGSALPKGVDPSLQLELHNVLAARLLSRLPQDLSLFSMLSPVQWDSASSPATQTITAGEIQHFRLDPLDHRLGSALYFRLRIDVQPGEIGRA